MANRENLKMSSLIYHNALLIPYRRGFSLTDDQLEFLSEEQGSTRAYKKYLESVGVSKDDATLHQLSDLFESEEESKQLFLIFLTDIEEGKTEVSKDTVSRAYQIIEEKKNPDYETFIVFVIPTKFSTQANEIVQIKDYSTAIFETSELFCNPFDHIFAPLEFTRVVSGKNKKELESLMNDLKISDSNKMPRISINDIQVRICGYQVDDIIRIKSYVGDIGVQCSEIVGYRKVK